MIKIRFATKEDIPDIICFLREHWREDSILVRSKKIFDFQYVDGEACNFVLAIDQVDKKIYGLKGFIPLNGSERPDVAAALAIVLQGVRPMLGMEIQHFLERQTNCRWLCATGLNPHTSARIYRLFKNYTVDTLKHYYRLVDREDYQVAVIKRKRIPPIRDGQYILERFTSIEELTAVINLEEFRLNKPYKDAKYLKHRYFSHPIYEYQVVGIRPVDTQQVKALLIMREIYCNGRKVLRIVDFIGEQQCIGEIGRAFEQMIEQRNYEYIDFYCYGIRHEYLEHAGFVLRDADDPNIIPNYFEPFEQKNVEIIFFATDVEGAVICKADGDQDRPNILPEGWNE